MAHGPGFKTRFQVCVKNRMARLDGCGGIPMSIVKRAEPVAVTLAVLCIATAVLWMVKQTSGGDQHLVFFYLLPTALMAILYGRLAAALCACFATICAAFFLYDPIYSFYVASPLDLGELICATGLALLGGRCTADLLRPAYLRNGAADGRQGGI
jgi:K+-sensing histidine kinase KdpD